MKGRRALHSKAVWPPPALVGAWVFIYAGLHATIWLFETMVPGARNSVSSLPEVVNVQKIFLALAGGTYAVFRVNRFHPACSPGYAAWLKLSPWTPNRPLPFGPVHPVWQDAIVVGVIVAVAQWHARLNPAIPALSFGLVYFVGMSFLLVYTRQWKSSIALAFLWPAMILPAVQGWPMIALAVAIIAVVWHGHRMSLKAFPWDFIAAQPRGTSLLQIDIGLPNQDYHLRNSNVGWPFASLSPKLRSPAIPLSAGLTISLLFGWWLYCILVRFKVHPFPEMILAFAIFAALVRLMIYCGGVANSFNVWGRIASGRLIVPRYDQVFLAPIAAILLALFGAVGIRRAEMSSASLVCALGAVVAFIVLCGGPSLKKWLLTAQHRFRPPSRLATTKQVLRPI